MRTLICLAVVCTGLVSSACSDPERDRIRETTRPTYDNATGLVRAEEDTNGDGRPDKWETYGGGALKTAAFDENGDGKPDRRLTYDNGQLTLIESEPDGAGAFTRHVSVHS